jgi:RNA polymerase sigma factor (sigma-70 family)
VVAGCEPTDAELWARGDADAFGLLFERHARAVYNHSFRTTANWAEAEDAASLVFLEAWRRRAGVRLDRESALPWLLGVATNVLRNRRRSLRRSAAAVARMRPEQTPDFADDVEARLDDEQAMRAVLGVVGRLPRREREVLALVAWDGLSYEAAALALALPVGTVRSRLSRARARLRELTDDGGHEPGANHAVPVPEDL